MPPSIRLLRPSQWMKSAFVFAPLFFAGKFMHADAWKLTMTAALGFLAAAWIVYIINDLRDISEDRAHPVKKNRPLASGEISVSLAALMACVAAAVTLFMLMWLPPGCTGIVLLYLAANLLYTLVLKHHAIFDVFFIAFFYVLRVLMGCFALDVAVSPWIILSTFLLALFLGVSKRRHEIGVEAYAGRKANLQAYSREFLDRLITISGCAAFMSYAIYAAEIEQRLQKSGMIYTVGFVAFGLFRYLQSVYVKGQGGEPEAVILRDPLQLVNLLLWLTVTMWILYPA